MINNPAAVYIRESSAEQVALKLTNEVLFSIEQRKTVEITRKEYLDTYAECLTAAKGHRRRSPDEPKTSSDD